MLPRQWWSGEGIDRDDVLDLVAGLVEQSLVQVAQRQGTARYRLLETIRVYARQRLSELDNPDRVRDRHLEFHVGLAGRAQEGLQGGQPEPWMARLAADLDDLRAAMDWAAESGDLRGLVGITEPIVRFWFDRGLSREVHRRLHDAADVPGIPDDERVRGLITAAALALASEEPASAYRSASKAVAAARAADVGGALAVALGQRAFSGAMSGLPTSAQVDADVEQAVQHAERCEDASTHAYVLAFAGGALFYRRSIDAACRRFEQAVEVCEANELAFQLPAAHASLGLWEVWTGRLDRSRRHARRRRRAQPAGRTSRVGGDRTNRPGRGCRPARQPRSGAGLAVRGAGGPAKTWFGGDPVRHAPPSLARFVGIRIR